MVYHTPNLTLIFRAHSSDPYLSPLQDYEMDTSKCSWIRHRTCASDYWNLNGVHTQSLAATIFEALTDLLIVKEAIEKSFSDFFVGLK